MPTFRIVYIDDDTFAPRTLTAAFADRRAAEIAMAKHGHRVVHLVEMGVGESASDPVKIPMVEEGAGEAGSRPGKRVPGTRPLLGLPRHDLAGIAVMAVGLAVAGAAILLF